jgi:hypothetical protein
MSILSRPDRVARGILPVAAYRQKFNFDPTAKKEQVGSESGEGE